MKYNDFIFPEKYDIKVGVIAHARIPPPNFDEYGKPILLAVLAKIIEIKLNGIYLDHKGVEDILIPFYRIDYIIGNGKTHNERIKNNPYFDWERLYKEDEKFLAENGIDNKKLIWGY